MLGLYTNTKNKVIRNIQVILHNKLTYIGLIMIYCLYIIITDIIICRYNYGYYTYIYRPINTIEGVSDRERCTFQYGTFRPNVA